MTPTFRDATEADLAAIVEIYNDEILPGTATFHTEPQTIADRAQWFKSIQTENYPCLVAEVEDPTTQAKRTVAWCNLWHYNMRPAYDGTAELSLYVHKDFRACGVGAKLLEQTLQETRKQGGRFHTIIAGVTTDNSRRTRFWAEHGFELRGTLTEVGRKFGMWLDVSYYQLML
ncbi:GCN5-related N-acetyltransferase [Polyporus arcularius HHB13444]|uniref:GCN5-related N-acetyltransferase n=1 Tax=Polyporus arcularius HHB13444 TaxID=1314778 RepID=A0A5C3PYA7_9APHY|nr:GCN5-related N-acetyltransferase [Polyporus arcularius HHB13444]